MKIRLLNINEVRNPDLFELDEAEDIVRLILKKILSLSREDWSIESNQQVANFVIKRQDVQNILSTTEGLSEDAIRVKMYLIDDEDETAWSGKFNFNDKNSSYLALLIKMARTGKLSDFIVSAFTRTIAHELNHYYDIIHKKPSSEKKNLELWKIFSLSPYKDTLISIIEDITKSKYNSIKDTMTHHLDINEIRSYVKEVVKQMIYYSGEHESFYNHAQTIFTQTKFEKIEETPEAKEMYQNLMYVITHLWEIYYNEHYKDEIIRSR